MTPPVLTLDAVSKRYWRGPHPIDILKEVSMDLERGDVSAVWGPRGAGKSTLLEIAAGMQRPDAGSVWLDGRDLAASRGLSEIGIATREGPSSWDLPASDWVALALIDRVGAGLASRRAHETLQRLGVGNLSGARWDHLSDGERRLVSIAQAIVREPRLLLVDDLTAGLALLERIDLMTILRSLASDLGMSILVTASDVADVQGCRPVWALGGGKLVGGRPVTGTILSFPSGKG